MSVFLLYRPDSRIFLGEVIYLLDLPLQDLTSWKKDLTFIQLNRKVLENHLEWTLDCASQNQPPLLLKNLVLQMMGILLVDSPLAVSSI